MATTKITQRDYFNGIIAYLKGEDTEFSTEDMVSFVEGRLAMLDKKSATRKNSKESEEDTALKDAVLTILADGERKTVSAIMAENPSAFEGKSNQKVSAILRKLIAEGQVAKDKDKKSTVFFAV